MLYTYGMKMKGIRGACGWTKFTCGRSAGIHVDVYRNLRTKELVYDYVCEDSCIRHGECMSGDRLIHIANYYNPTMMQQIADDTYRVIANKRKGVWNNDGL